MVFKNIKLCYINPLLYRYVWLKVVVIWHGIRNIIEKLPGEYRNQLLKEVSE